MNRDYLGALAGTVADANWLEAALGTNGRSAEQWDIWQAVYSPQGSDGCERSLSSFRARPPALPHCLTSRLGSMASVKPAAPSHSELPLPHSMRAESGGWLWVRPAADLGQGERRDRQRRRNVLAGELRPELHPAP